MGVFKVLRLESEAVIWLASHLPPPAGVLFAQQASLLSGNSKILFDLQQKGHRSQISELRVAGRSERLRLNVET